MKFSYFVDLNWSLANKFITYCIVSRVHNVAHISFECEPGIMWDEVGLINYTEQVRRVAYSFGRILAGL